MSIYNDPSALSPTLSAEQLAARGFLLPVEVSPPQSLTRVLAAHEPSAALVASGFAMIDTDAGCCCVEESVLRRLQLQPVNQVEVRSPNGPRRQSVFLARFSFPGSAIPPVDRAIVGVQMGDDETIALIGRDFLLQCLLVYNGPAGSCSLAF